MTLHELEKIQPESDHVFHYENDKAWNCSWSRFKLIKICHYVDDCWVVKTIACDCDKHIDNRYVITVDNLLSSAITLVNRTTAIEDRLAPLLVLKQILEDMKPSDL